MKKAMVIALALLFVLSAANIAAGENQFAVIKNRLAAKLAGKVERAEIEDRFHDARVVIYPGLVNKITKPGGKKFSYFSPEFGLFTPDSILRGRSVLKEKENIFTEAEKQYCVKREALAAIFRIETNLGRNVGTHIIFNNLLTFAVVKNRRSDWAENELVSLFLLGARNNLDILNIRGSWAGAFGLYQFMPSSFLAFARDGNGDMKIDLFDFYDAMFSAANYLKRHGWENGDPQKMKKAVFAYNHSDEYVRAVLAYAKTIKQ